MTDSLPQFHGIIAYPVTPFDASGAVDEAALRRLIDRLIGDGAHAIAPLGSTGESAYLSDDEWQRVAAISIEQVRKRVPVIVGVSDLTTEGAAARARFADQRGGDAVMLLPVSYWKLSEAEIHAHVKAVAHATRTPVMLYNNPATSGVDMSPESIVRMVNAIDNVTMVKESSGDIAQMTDLVAGTPDQFNVLAGSATTFYASLCVGATGGILALACVLPEACVRLFKLTRDGRHDEAAALQRRLVPVAKLVGSLHGVPGLKAALRLVDCDAGLPRPPLAPVSEAVMASLREVLVSFEEVALV